MRYCPLWLQFCFYLVLIFNCGIVYPQRLWIWICWIHMYLYLPWDHSLWCILKTFWCKCHVPPLCHPDNDVLFYTFWIGFGHPVIASSLLFWELSNTPIVSWMRHLHWNTFWRFKKVANSLLSSPKVLDDKFPQGQFYWDIRYCKILSWSLLAWILPCPYLKTTFLATLTTQRQTCPLFFTNRTIMLTGVGFPLTGLITSNFCNLSISDDDDDDDDDDVSHLCYGWLMKGV